MFAEHIVLDAPESIDDCRDLVHDVEAVAPVINHFLYSAHLYFNAAQTLDLLTVFDTRCLICKSSSPNIIKISSVSVAFGAISNRIAAICLKIIALIKQL